MMASGHNSNSYNFSTKPDGSPMLVDALRVKFNGSPMQGIILDGPHIAAPTLATIPEEEENVSSTY